MQRTPIIPTLLTPFIVLAAGYLIVQGGPMGAVNPDPDHAHADFAVWVDGKQLDFSGAEYMSGSSTDASSHPTEGLRKFLHLHDGNGHVIHRHKPGLTLRDFFESLGTKFRYIDNNRNLCIDFPQIPEVCQNEALHKDWVMVVNGEQSGFDTSYVFNDGDKILVFFNDASSEDADSQRMQYWSQMTDDACLYSQTCPWRGKAPTENCIADPEVPCVE